MMVVDKLSLYVKYKALPHNTAPPWKCCQLLTACLPAGNYLFLFLCSITSSWPPQGVQRKIRNLFAHCSLANICVLTRWLFAWPLVHNGIILRSQGGHKHTHIHHTGTDSTLLTRTPLINIRNKHTNTCCYRDRSQSSVHSAATCHMF